MYLVVLDRQRNFATALDFLQGGTYGFDPYQAISGVHRSKKGGVAEALTNNLWDRDYRVLELLCALGKYDEAVEAVLPQLALRPDDWRLYDCLINATVALAKESEERQSE